MSRPCPRLRSDGDDTPADASRDTGTARSRIAARERARAVALDDRALVDAMRAGDPWAWSEFPTRFRPILAAAARGERMPDGVAVTATEALVDEVLNDEAQRLVAPGAPVVSDLASYLVRAARHRLLNVRRSAARRRRRYADASTGERAGGETVVAALCSAHLLAVSAGVREPSAPRWGGDEPDHPDAAPPAPLSPAVLELASMVRAATSDDERLLLTWVAEQVSHRMIAEWLGISYDAATKRIWRLCRKLQAAAVRHVGTLDARARADVDRFLRRAGVLPPLVAAVSPAAARRELPRCPFGEDPAPGDARARSRASPISPPDRPPHRRAPAPPESDHER